ncbi:chloride channel protein [Lyngbya aestuarii]|uniref:chloride channel protein n=1 Tax=Lyngbya aestuarii TaxID=118322 RepID=UPI00403D68ED
MRRVFWSRLVQQLLQPKRLAIFEACFIGLVAALAAVLLKTGISWLGSWRILASQVLPAWLVLPGIGLGGGLIAGILVERLAPETAGSGIPQVKAVLSRVPIPLDLRVAVIKLIGGIITLASGLTLGREGPTVQVGAALADQLSRWIPTSPEYRRQLIAAGAGAGLAAAFNAPIAGVLFVVEELLQDMSELTLGTAILASFIGAVVSKALGGHSLDIHFQEVSLQTSFSVEDIPFYIALGVLAGLLGALFNRGIIASLTFNRRVLRLGLPAQIGLAGFISGLVIAMLPIDFRDSAGLREILITGQTSWQIPAIAFVVQFILTLVAYGSGAPGGLFAPTLSLGAALGYFVGLWEQNLLGIGLPTTYALAGMGAFFCAVARVPITSIVIVFEMTTDFNVVLPLMICCIIAYLVAQKAAPGSIYDLLLEWSGIHLEAETTRKGELAALSAADVMQRRVETLSSQMSLEEAVEAFSRSQHRGFPVVDQGKLIGIITQKDLTHIGQGQLSGDTQISNVMTAPPLTVQYSDTLTHVLYLLNRHNISRLPVTEGRRLVGIITRSDIIRAQSDQFKDKTATVKPQAEPSYVVYQTHGPAVGQGRLLLPLANPQTAASLIQMAAAIARDRSLELECLQVIVVPRKLHPAETEVTTTASRRLLQGAVRLADQLQIPVHTQVRVAHDVAQAILETIKERNIDLVLMGWKGSTTTPGRVFGSIYDTIIRQAACEVVLVKLGTPEDELTGLPVVNSQLPTLNRWLVPMAGGPNAQEAVRLLPGLVSLSNQPEIRLCQVFSNSEDVFETTVLEQTASMLSRRLRAEVVIAPVCANSVPEAVLDLAQKNQCDVIILGASREKLLQQVIKGNIPEVIARQSGCTVIVVRGASV